MPTRASVYIDKALSTFASAYSNGALLADAASPIIPTAQSSGKYFSFSRKDASTIRSDLMAPDAEANRSSYDITNAAFTCLDYGLKDVIDNDTINQADPPLSVMTDSVDNLMLRLMLSREDRVATQLHTTGSYAAANTSAAANKWDDETNGTPLADLHAMIAALAPGAPGRTRLVLFLGLEAWQALARHPDMRGGGALRPVVTRQEAASLVGIDEILVSDAQKNTANEGQAASYTRIWDTTKAVLLRLPTGAPQRRQAMFCGTFRYNRLGSRRGVTVRRWEEPKFGVNGSQAVQVGFSDDEVVVQNDMGYLLTAVT